eukprot:CAMPEP_0173377350 /NCGR_PEP_ID=MMETSP1356-20130122/538_1 /TAXON_ID=77927 ORGANISM="Hemiselmis virescens, Strain PCC157" /NCGR_SAMPLE_ID=MMETSP1356 /ASSEMBLY_ACC=CAM_ASM_000847 /LENGTH=196 /DNA_ID=CAMNT_0014330027 /DNA_START=174 /DNA_END=761 /DNA_ORIENTATION=-
MSDFANVLVSVPGEAESEAAACSPATTTQASPMLSLPSALLQSILERLSWELLEMCCQVYNRALRGELKQWEVSVLCWVLAEKGVDEVVGRLRRRVPAGIAADLGRLDQLRRFVERHRDRATSDDGIETFTVCEWMQMASQEPDEGWVCKGAKLKQTWMERWHFIEQVVGKPQEYGPVLCTLRGHSDEVNCVAFSP